MVLINKLIELRQMFSLTFIYFWNKLQPTYLSPIQVKHLNDNKNLAEIPSYTNDNQKKFTLDCHSPLLSHIKPITWQSNLVCLFVCLSVYFFVCVVSAATDKRIAVISFKRHFCFFHLEYNGVFKEALQVSVSLGGEGLKGTLGKQ